MSPHSILDKNKDLGRAGAKGARGVWSPNRHVWAPNQKAYSFENNGFCAYFQTLPSPRLMNAWPPKSTIRLPALDLGNEDKYLPLRVAFLLGVY